MAQSSPLASLMARVRESRARYDAICPAIPEGLREQVKPGPLDDKGWSLLATNSAVASKLRQLLPEFEQSLLDRGWQGTRIRIRVQSG